MPDNIIRPEINLSLMKKENYVNLTSLKHLKRKKFE